MYLYVPKTRTLHHEDIGVYVSTGVIIFDFSLRSKKRISEVVDISVDKKLVSRLAKECNKKQVKPAYIDDIINDYIDVSPLETA